MPEKIGFHVVHASGQDENFRAAELNAHSPLTRGWSSSRFCIFPQDIVIQLDRRCRLHKVQILTHQYLIPSRIEFYVGDIPSESSVSLQNARYTRLGYIALSDNEQTDFKARELKSVHVDAVGIFLKLVIHKNHVNKHNLYNQVGIIAINVIGDDLDKVNQISEPFNNNNALKPDFISPLDDLAFDMYQDPEVAQVIRKLEKKKQDSVLEEKYDYAKRLKQVIAELQKVGERLGKFEVEKRQAVESEDYDKAKLKKLQMEEYRLQMYKQLELHELLQDIEPDYNTSPRRDQHPTKLKGIQGQLSLPVEKVNRPIQPSPLPALQTSIAELPDPNLDEQNRYSVKGEKIPNDERPLPVFGKENQPPGLSPRQTGDQDDQGLLSPRPLNEANEPELVDENGGQTARSDAVEFQMSEKDQREAASVIDVFGLAMVQKGYARNWSSKEECLTDMVQHLSDFNGEKEEARALYRAAIFLVQKLLRDSVHAVFKAALNSQKYLLTVFVPKHRIPKTDIHYCVDKTLPEIIHKTGDTNARIRTDAKSAILEMSQYPELKATSIVPTYCVKPIKPSTAPRLAQINVELVDELYSSLGDQDSGLTVTNMMKFCAAALQHPSGSVRTATEVLIIKLYKQYGSVVKSYLPPDDDKTRRNTLYRHLFEAFDQIDGKPSKKELEKQRQAEEAARKAEVEALQQQIAQMKALQAASSGNTNVVPTTTVTPAPKGSNSTAAKKFNAQKRPSLVPPTQDDDAISTVTKFDKTCIFCNEHNESFTEEGLDLHYWKSCPMLKRCTNCKQVVEIAGLTEHLLTECEAKSNYNKCPRCSEAILKTEFDEHVKAKACNPADPKKSHCPLCHQNIPIGEASWTEHLMSTSPDACKQNPRRVAAQNKGKGKPTAASNKQALPTSVKAKPSKPGRK